jgi:hypothetical protein
LPKAVPERPTLDPGAVPTLAELARQLEAEEWTAAELRGKLRDSEETIEALHHMIQARQKLDAIRQRREGPRKEGKSLVIAFPTKEAVPGPTEAILRVMAQDPDAVWDLGAVYEAVKLRGWLSGAGDARRILGATLSRLARRGDQVERDESGFGYRLRPGVGETMSAHSGREGVNRDA